MSAIERACVRYFTNAIGSGKQSEQSPVRIRELNIYLTRATPGIRKHIKSVYKGNLAKFLRRYPESFQLDGNGHIFLTSDFVHMHGTEILEEMSVQFFKDKLGSMKAFRHSTVPVWRLRKFLGEASASVQALFNLNYPGREITRFFENHPNVFGVSLSGNAYLVDEAPAALLGNFKFNYSWHSDTDMFDSELSKDEADAVEFYRQELNSPGTELQMCSMDSLFALLRKAPINVQLFIKKTYTEVNFLDFFNMHKSSFFITTIQGQTTRHKGRSSSDQSSASSQQVELHCETLWGIQLSGDGPVVAKQIAIQYFEGVLKDYMVRGIEAHVEKLRKCLTGAPLLVFSYFCHFYCYRQFEQFFLDHATHFSIYSTGVVELSAGGKRKASQAENIISDFCDYEESGAALNLGKQLEKFFLDLFNLTCSYGIRVVDPKTLLAVSACLHPRLSRYLLEHHGKNIISFFQLYKNHFKVSKYGNVRLAVEKESDLKTMANKKPAVLALEVFVSLMQLLETHQVKAVPPEILWKFLPLTPLNVRHFLKDYDKKTLINFLLKHPTMFAISKRNSIYLSTGPVSLMSNNEGQGYHRASENLYEAPAIEFFVELINSLRVSTYPVPVVVLQNNLAKASPSVKNYFEEIYPQDKFLDFFIKYEDFFFVLKPVGVIWLVQTEREDEQAVTEAIEYPFSSQPKAFYQVVGVIVADLLVKSPKPFSTVLCHLNVIKEQSRQELNKYQGKSNTEKLFFLVKNCFGMFKIEKDNIILSWPLKHHASLLFVLEEALAAICTKLATSNIVKMATFRATMRHKVERMFQCLIPDTVTMLYFLRKRDEFLVLDEEQFIVLSSEALPNEQAEEIAQLVEAEVSKNGSGSTPLASVLSALLEESFEHPFTSSTVVQAILIRKNRFRLQDGQLSLLEKVAWDGEVNCETNLQGSVEPRISSDHLGDPPAYVHTMGWIISLGEEGGVLAACFDSSCDYTKVFFSKAFFSQASISFTQLYIGQKVEFLAVRETKHSEWNVMKLLCTSDMPFLPGEKLSNEQSDDADPSDHASGPPSEDDDSTNDHDSIFLSAADSEPTVTSGLDVDDELPSEAQLELVMADNLTSASCEPLQKTVERTAVCSYENSALDSTAGIEANTLDDEDDQWEDSYDCRNVSLSLFTKADTSSIRTKTGGASLSAVTKPQDVPLPSYESNCDAVPDEAHDRIQNFLDSRENPQDFEASSVVADQADSGEPAEVWNGAAIWDIDPTSETVKTLRTDIYEQAKQESLCDKDGAGGKPPKGWDRELLTISTSEVNDSMTMDMLALITAYNATSQELVQAQEPIRCACGAEATDCSQATLERSPEPEGFFDKAAVVGDSEEKALDTATGGDEHQSLALSSDWKLAEVLPFCMLLEELEIIYSVSATVVHLCPLVAVLVSRVRGLPVKLVLTPDDCAAFQWPLLCLGQKVAVRAVGDLSDSSILRVVRLQPLKSQPDVQAPDLMRARRPY